MIDSVKNPVRQVLIIEDDPEIAHLIELHLKDINCETYHCLNGSEGVDMAIGENYNLIILDLMLPDMDGLDVCRTIREQQNYTPILMLTSRAEEFDRVLGLEMGADDYLTKPFSIRELIARIKAIFRRIEAISEKTNLEKEKLTYPDLEVDLSKRSVKVEGKPVNLTVKEFDLLQLLACHPGRAYSRENLLLNVWGYQFSGYDHTVNSHINRLRSKIEKDPSQPRFIRTVWGHGYRFAEKGELEQ
jgi:two-component system, OmpR family, alkaline phosphatase synthesis response regulator PhoP